MTDSIQKKYSEISYVLEEDAPEEEAVKPQTNGKPKKPEGSSSSAEENSEESYDDDVLDEDDMKVVAEGDDAHIYGKERKLRSKVQE